MALVVPKHLRWLTLSLLLLVTGVSAASSAEEISEDQVKAAYLFNFAKFVTWPPQAFGAPDSPINFCTLGRSGTIDELDSSIKGKIVNGHPIVIRHLHGFEEINNCHIFFLADSAGKRQQELFQAVGKLPVLLVGETSGFAQHGGDVDFIVDNGKVIFEVNTVAAENAHLKISSKLLTLARIVSPGAER